MCYVLHLVFIRVMSAGILNSVKEIRFYVICNERINYAEYIKKFIAGKECTLKIFDKNSFLLTSGCDTVLLSFKARLIHGRPKPGLIFAQSALRGMRLSSLAYGIVCLNKRITYITNDMLTSKHECKFDICDLDLDQLKRLADCKLYSSFCTKHPQLDLLPEEILFCSKRSHNLYWKNECQCKLCVKTGPASLKSLSVNKLGSLPSRYRDYKL
jgi:hypothetical protein